MSSLTCTFPNNRVFRRVSELEEALGLTHSTSNTRSHADQNNFYVQLDLPGVRKEDVTIKVEADELKITAVRNLTQNGETKSFTTHRTFSLSDEVDAEKITAEQKDGVLSITLPKKEEAKPKTVNISVN